jgi:hypothetical protein
MVQNNYSHLPLPFKIKDRPYLTGGGYPSPTTLQNQTNRSGHGGYLTHRATSIRDTWKQKIELRDHQGLPSLPLAIPILLQIDPDLDSDFLRSFGFEIVSEQEDGFVVIATEDIDMNLFQEKLQKFIQNLPRSGSAGRIHQMFGDEDINARLQRILSEQLFLNWTDILDDRVYTVDVGIECLGTYIIPEPVSQNDGETDDRFLIRQQRWESKVNEIYMQIDELRLERENLFERFIRSYNGQILSIFEESDAITSISDSFTIRLEISGKGLKDISLNFPFVFEVSEPDQIDLRRNTNEFEHEELYNIEFIPPEENAPKVCVIDSGIQEGHRLLEVAIDSSMSNCYLPGETDISDRVGAGGHGTKVAGAVLYHNEIPKTGEVSLPLWLQNAKVLDEFNRMPSKMFPPKLLGKIVERFFLESNTRIYNHSITGFVPFRLQHMSSWAAEMDNLSYINDILFIQAAGNIYVDYNGPFRYGILQHITAGRDYPDYLLEQSCRLPSPAQSLQSITVGSICYSEISETDRKSLGDEGWPSAFSATGLGIWDTIKPDVVEYGGTYVIDNGTPPFFTNPPEVCPELIRSSPPGFAKDDIGTSFAAPKVAHIAAMIQRVLPEEPTLLYRALIAQSARWPEWALRKPSNEWKNVIRHIGYGVPILDRAIINSPYRVTLITSGKTEIFAKEAHVYEVPIPESIRSVGEEYDIMIEITLSYIAKPRRTRKKLRGYLSSWLDWKTSNIGESTESFSNRVLYGRDHTDRDDESSIPWTVGNRTNTGIDGISRNSGTLQKDWAIIKTHQLTDGFNIAVIGHPGWNKDPRIKAYYSLAVSFEAINRDIEIYDQIRTEVEAVINSEIEVEIQE